MRTKAKLFPACLTLVILCVPRSYGAAPEDGAVTEQAANHASNASTFMSGVGSLDQLWTAGKGLLSEHVDVLGKTMDLTKIFAKTADSYNKKGGGSAVFTAIKTTISVVAGKAAQAAFLAYFVPKGTVLGPKGIAAVVTGSVVASELTEAATELVLDKTPEAIALGVTAPFAPIEGVEGMAEGTPNLNAPRKPLPEVKTVIVVNDPHGPNDGAQSVAGGTANLNAPGTGEASPGAGPKEPPPAATKAGAAPKQPVTSTNASPAKGKTEYAVYACQLCKRDALAAPYGKGVKLPKSCPLCDGILSIRCNKCGAKTIKTPTNDTSYCHHCGAGKEVEGRRSDEDWQGEMIGWNTGECRFEMR